MKLDPIKIENEVDNNQAIILDVRTTEELEDSGWAKNAIHFDIVRIDDGEIPNINKNQKIYIYCRSGGRAEQVLIALKHQGYKQVYNIGGLIDWINAGGEIEKSN